MTGQSDKSGGREAGLCGLSRRFSAIDEHFMAEAIALAQRRLGQTGDNPAVGAVLVRQEAGEPLIVGRGVTAAGGRPHAEISALQQAGAKARGATAYVTLEPCCHFGRTPPCTAALIAAGIARAVIAVRDPDRRVNGQGIKALRQAGIKVESGCLAARAADDLAAYLCRKKFARPLITAKLAVSADGCIGRAGEGKVAISGAAAQRETHSLRAAHDAVLIGIGTALADNPRLDCRLLAGEGAAAPALRRPIRCVIDTDLRLSGDSYLAQTAHEQPVWLFCGKNAPADRRAPLQQAGCRIFVCASENGAIVIESLPALWAAEGINSVLLEGGARLMQAFWDKALIDRLIIWQSPLIIGAGGYKKPDFGDKNGYEKLEERRFGRDVRQTWLHIGGQSGLLTAA